MNEHPLKIDETAGVKYYCKCNLSRNFPYCDGAHSSTELYPYQVEIEKDKTVYICNCQKSKKAPFCDGSHKKQP